MICTVCTKPCHSSRTARHSLANQPRPLAEGCTTVLLLRLPVPTVEAVQQLPLPRRELDQLVGIVSSPYFDGWFKWNLILHNHFCGSTSRQRVRLTSTMHCSACQSTLCHWRSLKKGYSSEGQPRPVKLAERCKTVVLLALRVPKVESVEQLPLPRRERDKLASIVSSTYFDGWLSWYLIAAPQGHRSSSERDNFEDLCSACKEEALLFCGSSTLV